LAAFFLHFVKCYEAEKAKQHPVGVTFQWKGGSIYTSGNIVKKTFTPENLAEIRLGLGYTRRCAEKMNLIAMIP
jgi:hypothetical protein